MLGVKEININYFSWWKCIKNKLYTYQMIPDYKDYDYMISLHILYGVNLIIDYLNMYLKK